MQWCVLLEVRLCNYDVKALVLVLTLLCLQSPSEHTYTSTSTKWKYIVHYTVDKRWRLILGQHRRRWTNTKPALILVSNHLSLLVECSTTWLTILFETKRWNSWFLILDNHVKNKKYRKFVSISSLTGKCAAQQFKKICRSSLWTCLDHMVLLRSQNKIIDFLMILHGPVPLNITIIWYQMKQIWLMFTHLNFLRRGSETQLQVGETVDNLLYENNTILLFT